MSEAAMGTVQQPRGAENADDAAQKPVPPSLPGAPVRTPTQRILGDTLAGVGAKLGLLWIVLVAVLGITAPLLANSYPILIKAGGRFSSPLLANLNWADVTLLVGTVLGIPSWILTSNRLAWPTRLVCVSLGFAVIGIGAYLTVHSPQLETFDRFREMQRRGEVEWAIRTPIPFSPTDRLRDTPFDVNARPHPWPPSTEHWMGTEVNGSDIAARMIHACRIAMTIGFISTGLSTIIGVIVGAFTGYFAGWVDLIGQRLIDVFSAIPTMFLMLTAVAFFGRGLYYVMVIIGLTSWVGIASFVRAEFLRYRNVDFVQAARGLGLPLSSILFRHLLPNALAPVLVQVSFGVAGAILSESGLSFLGLGLIDEPSWGALLSQAVNATGGFLWWLAVFPGLAIFLTVFAYNLIGEAFRDALDPKLKKRD